ncbi:MULTISPECIES: ATP-binding protein [Thalassospira]|uniref:histidine kinase n=1 Tax=Thalassospira profundimaris TaxID=502049 RepID=A0A367VIN9_9PROT|nr:MULTISPECIES: ATP-binding protein [Thalassospira]KZB71567.1 histidine kinase [Thalassospira sp. MCCC 1A01148]MBR9898693.1 sensor histidine kinase [Rhodospirillales bacterium]RCK24110.1 histidine kinase [Thalassospira profundimaris]
MGFRQLILTALAVAFPVAIVFIVLASMGQLGVGTAILSAVLSFVGVAAMLRIYFGDLRRVARYATDLRDQYKGTPPQHISFSAASELSSLYTQIAAAFRDRIALLEAQTSTDAEILDHLPNPVVMVNRQRVVTGFNRAANGLFHNLETGRDLTRFIRDPILLDAFDDVANNREIMKHAEFVLASDAHRHFDVLTARLPAAAGDRNFVLTFSDLTELRKLEQMRADFATDAGHELRTPLSVLLGFIETLEGPAKDDPDALNQFLPVMRDQAQRMQHLIEDLLSLARIELNEHTPPSENCNVGKIIGKVAESLAMKAQDKGMNIRVTSTLDDTDMVGEEKELTQVFVNLVENAIKYGHTNSDVEVSISLAQNPPGALARFRHDRIMAVAIRDHSDGIAREHLPRLTERFYRVDTARSRAVGGTGLGLAIVKHLVQRHRGTMQIESEQGVGSVFTVYLPAKTGDNVRKLHSA